jgi:hypothetical protein
MDVGQSIFWLLAVLAMSFIGLWSVWAGLGRATWFLRVSVLLGWISLVLVIPAYELLVLFLVQAGVTIAILSLWRAWRSSRIARAGWDELPCGGVQRSRWQYSVRDLLLLAVLAAWLSAILTRVPAQVWMQSRDWLVTGAFAGGLAPAAAWIALSRRRWWLRLPVACLLFPSLLLVVWLLLARTAGLIRTTATASSWKRWGSRAALALLSLFIALPLAAIYWRLATPLPIPQVALPDPNGYDDLVKTGKILQSVNVPYIGPPINPQLKIATHAQMKDFVIRHDDVYDLIHKGLAKPCRVPIVWNDPDGKWFSSVLSSIDGWHGLARVLRVKAKDADLDGRIDDAVAADLDTIRLGRACSHGGLLVHWFRGNCLQGMGQDEICKLRKSLAKKQCTALIAALMAPTLWETSVEEILERDAIWIDNAYGWLGRLTSAIRTVTGADDAMYRQITGKAGTLRQDVIRARDRDLAKTRLLICDLAIRAHRLDRGRNPAGLADLVPDYLPEPLKDPFGGGQLVYRLTPDGYLLHSVGVNGIDDGGKQSSLAGLAEDGDIVLDDSPSASGGSAK